MAPDTGEVAGRELDGVSGICPVLAAAYGFKAGPRLGSRVKTGRQNEAGSKFDGLRDLKCDFLGLQLWHRHSAFDDETLARTSGGLIEWAPYRQAAAA
jgi:hypothetical protein